MYHRLCHPQKDANGEKKTKTHGCYVAVAVAVA